ncbi:two-component system, NarL family, sensor histidine kinase BarA [Microdochium nivale]|nr:two-component system, NarL family, sensor histidine kinase BarA [Microdochium nivale]
MVMDDAPKLASFFPKADQYVPYAQARLASSLPQCVLPSVGQVSVPLPRWSRNAQHALCSAGTTRNAATVDANPDFLEQYLVPSLARNERQRLTMFWYYTFGILDDANLHARLADKTLLASQTSGWDIALIGLVDMNTFTRIASQGVEPTVMPRRNSPCAHIVNQAPDSVLLVPDMLEDWRFAQSPTAQYDGTRAYAAAPLHFRTDSGESLMFGSLCVADSKRREPLTAAQRVSLARLADWCVADIVHSARTRRQQQRRRMADLLGKVMGQPLTDATQEACLAIVRSTYPHANVLLQPFEHGEIKVEGRKPIPFRDFEDSLWEDSAYVDEIVSNHNHESFPRERVIRVIAAPCQIASGRAALLVLSKDFTQVYDDIDSWFVLACADVLSRNWQERLLLDAKNARDQFLRGITHSLRTPIHGIIGSVDLLQEEARLKGTDDLGIPSPPVEPDLFGNESRTTHTKSHLDIIKAASQDLISMVNSIITWNRWSEISGSERLETLMDINEFEHQLLAQATKQALTATNNNIFLVIRHILPEDYDGVCIDMDLCKEAVVPVVLNALQHTTTGGIVITVSTCADRRKLIIDVHDTGAGLGLADQARIFGAFEKGNNYSVGAGLGLTLSSKFATLLDGDVQLMASTPGVGSHFRLTFQAVSYACFRIPVDSWLTDLAVLPRHFRHVGASHSSTLTPAHLFTEFLTSHGFAAAPDDEDALIIFEHVHDAEHRWDVPSEVLSCSVAVCFVPGIIAADDLAARASSVLQITGPVTTSTFVEAVREADRRWQAHTALRAAANNIAAEKLPEMNKSSASATFHASSQPLLGTQATVSKSLELFCHKPYLVKRQVEGDDDSHDGFTGELAMRPRAAELPDPNTTTETPIEGTVSTAVERTAPATTNVAVIPAASPQDRQRPVALLVDDNIINLRILQMYCKKRGLDYLSAMHGREAVELFKARQSTTICGRRGQQQVDQEEEKEEAEKGKKKERRISVVMMDFQMPECDGMEATRQIRQLEKEHGWPESTVFILTGQDNLCDKKDADEAGADEYYVKPVGIKTLDTGLSRYFPGFRA